MSQTNVQKYLAALVAPAQDIENALQQLLLNRAVDTAVGVQLDQLGVIVGQARIGLSDDDYRRYIRARIATSRSSGKTEDLIRIVSLIVSTNGALYTVVGAGTATVLVRVDSIAITESLGSIAFSFLKAAKAAGVRLVLQWSDSVPGSTFRLDAGPGLDVGHLASALST